MEPKAYYVIVIASTVWLCLQTGTMISAGSLQNGRSPRQMTNPNFSNPNIIYVRGAGCGQTRMQPNQITEITSPNFPIDNYYNKDACTWTFTATDCQLSMYCPCFSIPSSLGCLEDYLKITHLHFNDKFCGPNAPIGIYHATSDFIAVRFKTDFKVTGKGFLCHVRCTAVGREEPYLTNVTCPAGAANPFGNITLIRAQRQLRLTDLSASVN